MKRLVWKNKSNGQLCVTIPKNSGINVGDIVSIEKEKIKCVVYTAVTGDMFHYGHLRVLQAANKLGDLHICGVLTNEAIASYKGAPIADLKERLSIISALRCVDQVMSQDGLDPTKNLKKIHEEFPDAKIVLVYGSNWKKVPGERFIRQIKGEIVQPPFYEKLSTEKIIKKILRTFRREEQR